MEENAPMTKKVDIRKVKMRDVEKKMKRMTPADWKEYDQSVQGSRKTNRKKAKTK